MWINVRFFDGRSNVLQELGRYGEEGLPGHPTLLDPESTRVYECKPGLSPEQARTHNRSPGPSFHFILNDFIAKDNRIPPRGYRKSAFAEHLAAPIGAEYADGQYWDVAEFDLPPRTERVEVRLMYQSVSWEYLKFLVEENHTDKWGKDLYAAWEQTGKCPPEEIAHVAKNMRR